MQTIADFYRYCVTEMTKHQVYFGHGTEDVLTDAWWLIAGALKLPVDDCYKAEFLPCQLLPEECQFLQDLIYKRTVEKIPTAYLLKEAYQNGYKFYVDERVLIPRSPIAELIENRFSPWIEEEKVTQILDLCTGSGCLAILAAYAFPGSRVDATDLSPDALEVAKQNVEMHGLSDQINLIQSDVFSGLPARKYDVIISNPPYVDLQDLNSMPAEYHREPRMALEAGEDGLTIVHQILAETKTYLNSGGILIVEVGNSAAALVKAYADLPFIWLEFERGGSGVFLLNESDL